MTEVFIYTDGSARSTGGPGGWAALLIAADGRRKEISGSVRYTNHNRMEVYAAVQALRSLNRPCRVNLWGDSEYLIKNMAEGRVERWSKFGWVSKSGATPNADIWQLLLIEAHSHEVSFAWLKGHKSIKTIADEEERQHYLNNHRCDELAGQAAQKANEGMFTFIDDPYEQLMRYKPQAEEHRSGRRATGAIYLV